MIKGLQVAVEDGAKGSKRIFLLARPFIFGLELFARLSEGSLPGSINIPGKPVIDGFRDLQEIAEVAFERAEVVFGKGCHLSEILFCPLAEGNIPLDKPSPTGSEPLLCVGILKLRQGLCSLQDVHALLCAGLKESFPCFDTLLDVGFNILSILY